MSGFYGDARQAFRQDSGLIDGVLAVEDVGGRHGNDAYGDVLCSEGFLRFQSQLDFGTGGNDDGLGVALCFADDVAAAFDVVQLLFVARLEFQVLTAENQAGRMVLTKLCMTLACRACFIGMKRTLMIILITFVNLF